MASRSTRVRRRPQPFYESAGGTDDEGSDEDMYPARTTTKRRRGGSMGAAGVTPSRGTKKTRMGGVEEGDEEEGEEEGEEGLDTSNANADRRASAPASKQASRGGGNTPNSGRKSKSRSSTGGIEAGMGGEDDLLLGGGGAAGGGQGMGNGLLEAVRRNAALSTVVADWVTSYQQDSNEALEELLNFVLLACGATATDGPYRPPEGVGIADMQEEEWAELMKVVTEDMQGVPQSGAGGVFPLAPASKGKAGKAARAFRSNFCEVFQRMTEACRDGTAYDTGVLSAVASTLLSLSQQASADVRFAATLAAMELGLGVAEGLAELYTKLAVAQRQYDGANAATTPDSGRAKPSTGGAKGKAERAKKAQALAARVDRITDAVASLTEVSDKVYSSVTQKRYRDVSPLVRSSALDGLTDIMLALPDVYVQDKLLRYLGWSLNDKASSVRTVALQAMQRLLRDEASASRMEKFCGHFLGRVKAMLFDVDAVVCREAGVVLRLMLAVGFLADMERDDEMEVESAIFEQDLPLAARTECMGFFVDRLQEFVETDAEKAAASGGGPAGKRTPMTGGRAGGRADADEDEEHIALVRLESLVQLIDLHAREGGEVEGATAGAPDAVDEEQRLSCADSAVQAIWTLPQAPVVRSWRALFKLLDDEEAGGGRGTRGGGRSGGGRGGGGGGEGALNGGEQTVAARVLLTAARMAAGEAASGRRKAGGQSLSKEAKQDLRESLSELAEACLTHLPNLLAKYQSDDAKLALLSGLPVHLPTEALASLVSGKGKEAFSDLLSRIKDAFLMSNSPEVMDASAASLRFFLDASHAKRAEVEAVVQEMMGELFSKACKLCHAEEMASKKTGAAAMRNWKNTAVSLSTCLRRLRSLTGCVDPGASSEDTEALSQLWEAVKNAVSSRCLLDEVLPPKTPPNQYQERLDMARGVVEEGCRVLYALFLWQMRPLFERLRLAGSAPAPAGAERPGEGVLGGGDGGDEGPGSKEQGGSPMEAEDITEEMVKAVAGYRDDLVEVLRAMLSMHRSPRKDEDGEEYDNAGSQNEIQGSPRVLTIDQKVRLVRPARRAAWTISNELQTLLKAFLSGVEGPLASLAWQPNKPFTRLLQEHFETQEDAMIASAIKADRRDPKNKGDTKDGLKAEKGQDGHSSEANEVDEDVDDDEEGDIRDEAGSLKIDLVRDADDLLLPLMKSIYSNVDRLNRRQAAAVVAHLVHSSAAASDLAKCFVSKLREYSPVRCLEVHMSTLRVFYDKWLASAYSGEDGGGGSDAETRAWDLANAGLDRWLPLAHRLSTSLGVGPLRSRDAAEQKTLQDVFLRFMKEGLRFALDSEGDRLLFLEGLREYASKVTPRQKKILANFFDQEANGLHHTVLAEGRKYATLWDAGEVEHQQVAPHWRAFFSLRNALVPGDASSFIPQRQSGESAGYASSSSPAASASASSVGTPSSVQSRRASGGAPFSAGRGPRASTAKSRASTTGDLLLPVAEEEEEEHYQEGEGGNEGEGEQDGAGSVPRGLAGNDDMQSVASGRSMVSEVRTPNKRRLAELERFEEAKADEADDLLDDLEFNPSDAAPSTTSKKRGRFGADS